MNFSQELQREYYLIETYPVNSGILPQHLALQLRGPTDEFFSGASEEVLSYRNLPSITVNDSTLVPSKTTIFTASKAPSRTFHSLDTSMPTNSLFTIPNDKSSTQSPISTIHTPTTYPHSTLSKKSTRNLSHTSTRSIFSKQSSRGSSVEPKPYVTTKTTGKTWIQLLAKVLEQRGFAPYDHMIFTCSENIFDIKFEQLGKLVLDW